MRFENKVAVITGAGQGIGETYAKRIASEGAKVVIAELNEEQGRRVASEIGEAAIFVKTDVSDPASCQALADAAKAAFGGVDYLINNAAIFAGMRYEPLMSVDIDYYMKFMAVNLHGALFVTRAIVPLMEARGGGAIVNQSSTAAYLSGSVGAYYGISKLGTNGLTMSLAAELGPKNIRVNGVAPGPTMTGAMQQVDEKVIAGIVGQMPLGRIGETDEQANAVLFLLSDEASFITGQTLCVDGGMIRKP
ncbi:SDR family oxidoreductase [Sphingobium sp. TCM1]|uniref:SDR family oxidoreductase n=1 Tax=Sphingobium sp. TCM1 TaxID=453246 RepID=UPI0007F53DC8|nr:SDR family oxidoreductase [Sphingobium sp. TCM1]OAN58257.1 short-chain dehydrogenase [Sphingobium sp. TCM1]